MGTGRWHARSPWAWDASHGSWETSSGTVYHREVPHRAGQTDVSRRPVWGQMTSEEDTEVTRIVQIGNSNQAVGPYGDTWAHVSGGSDKAQFVPASGRI